MLHLLVYSSDGVRSPKLHLDLLDVSVGVRGLNMWAIFCCFVQVIKKKLN